MFTSVLVVILDASSVMSLSAGPLARAGSELNPPVWVECFVMGLAD